MINTVLPRRPREARVPTLVTHRDDDQISPSKSVARPPPRSSEGATSWSLPAPRTASPIRTGSSWTRTYSRSCKGRSRRLDVPAMSVTTA